MAVDLALSSGRYEEARAEERRPAGDWAHYAEKEMPELDDLAAAFHGLHADKRWSTLEQASNVLCFTQSCIAYAHDKETTPSAARTTYATASTSPGVAT